LPESRLLALTELLLRGRAGESEGLLEALDVLERDWGADPRLAVARSMVLAAQGRWEEAIDGLRPHLGAESAVRSSGDDDLILELVGEQLYFLLVEGGRHEEAWAMARRYESRNPGRWLERQGDLHLLAGEPGEASRAYAAARAAGNDAASILLRESDAAFLLGDSRMERALRESIYGSIAEDR
jgi:hypothetical protein